eukprot:14635908-Alexandrium_andersonii.AAC.1
MPLVEVKSLKRPTVTHATCHIRARDKYVLPCRPAGGRSLVHVECRPRLKCCRCVGCVTV